MTIKHAFNNPKADGADATIARPGDWNADHVVTDLVVTGLYATFNSTLKTWSNTDAVLQIGAGGTIFSYTGVVGSIYVGAGAYFNGGWKTLNATGTPSLYEQNGAGLHRWYSANAASTAANAAITWITSFSALGATFTWNAPSMRVQGDFSNATRATRTLLQDATTNNGTNVGGIPNGTSTTVAWTAFGASDPDNSTFASFGVTSGIPNINSTFAGTGTQQPFEVRMAGATKQSFNTDGTMTWFNVTGTNTLTTSSNQNDNFLNFNNTFGSTVAGWSYDHAGYGFYIGEATHSWRVNINATNGSFAPYADNVASQTCGASGQRWNAIWSANGTIQTSDARSKRNVANSALGLDFINALRPVSYQFIIGSNTHVPEPNVIEEFTMTDEDGNVTVHTRERLASPSIKPKLIPNPGQRTHWGLVAQEVKAAADRAGVDFGGWIKTDVNDPGSEEGLRYDQFIAPLIKAVQELSARVVALETQVRGGPPR